MSDPAFPDLRYPGSVEGASGVFAISSYIGAVTAENSPLAAAHPGSARLGRILAVRT